VIGETSGESIYSKYYSALQMGKVSKGKKRDSLKRKNKDDRQEASVLTEQNRNHFKKSLIYCLLIIAIGILAYSNTFHSPFQWDENDFLVQNPIVKNLKYFWEPSKASQIRFLFLQERDTWRTSLLHSTTNFMGSMFSATTFSI
jgi:hypothetical protein